MAKKSKKGIMGREELDDEVIEGGEDFEEEGDPEDDEGGSESDQPSEDGEKEPSEEGEKEEPKIPADPELKPSPNAPEEPVSVEEYREKVRQRAEEIAAEKKSAILAARTAPGKDGYIAEGAPTPVEQKVGQEAVEQVKQYEAESSEQSEQTSAEKEPSEPDKKTA